MIDAKDVFLAQLSQTHETSGWFTCLNDALKGITFEQAIWTANEQSNSIWSTMQHLAYWSEVYLEKYKPGSVGEMPQLENHMTFHIPNEDMTEENWEKAKARLDKVLVMWREALEENPGKIEEENWMKGIAGFLLHNAYHIGQIVTIRKQQESWTPSGL